MRARLADGSRLTDLVEQSVAFSHRCLKPGGTLLCKVLQGTELQPLLRWAKGFFAKGALVKPPASRDSSAECYLVARGFDPEAYAASPRTSM